MAVQQHPTSRSHHLRNALIALVVLIVCIAVAVTVAELRHNGPTKTNSALAAADTALSSQPREDLPRPGSMPWPAPSDTSSAPPTPAPPTSAQVGPDETIINNTGGGPRNQAPPSGVQKNLVSIPAQGVLAPVDGACVRRDGGIEPRSYNPRVTCYWDRGSMLGATQGEATILGHINYNGVDGALGRIGQLHIGDSIFTYDATGARTEWHVSQVVQRPKVNGVDPTAEKGAYGPKTLVLVTCGGRWVGGSLGYADLFWVHAVPA